MKPLRHAIVAIAAVAAIAPAARAALVTFSAFNNGVTTVTDPENTTTPFAFPANYQPLLNAYPAPGGNIDGANIGVTITYGNAFGANTASNSGVNEHTHQVKPTDTANENMYDNGNPTLTLTFDKPITMPSFFYSYFTAGSYTSVFKGFTNAADATPVLTLSRNYNAGSYAWQEETGFGVTPLQKVTFTQGGNFQQLDDLTINLAPTPEPASIALLGLGTTALLARRRRAR